MNNKIILLDNEDEVLLTDFIKHNTSEDVEPLTKTEIEDLNSLEIGQTIFIGICEVKRIS